MQDMWIQKAMQSHWGFYPFPALNRCKYTKFAPFLVKFCLCPRITALIILIEKKTDKMSNYDVNNTSYMKFIISYYKLHQMREHDLGHNGLKTVSQYDFLSYNNFKKFRCPPPPGTLLFYTFSLNSTFLVYFLQFSLKNATNLIKCRSWLT